MGYAKQMMELAQDWLRFNPDPKSPFLKVPGLDKNRGRSHGISPEKLRKLEAQAKFRPDVVPMLAQLKDLDRQLAEQAKNLHAQESELEDIIRSRKPGQDKYVLHESHPTAGQWILSWARSGYNAFDLSSDFTAAMLLTDARALDIDLVQLPFPAFLVTIPDGFAIGVEGRSYTKIHVTEVAATDVKMLHARDTVWDVLKDLPYDQAQKVLKEAQHEVDAGTIKTPSLLDHTSRSLLGPSPVVRASAELGSLHIYATDGVSVLDTWIDRKDLTWEAFDDLPDHVDADADKRARQTLRQIVFGMLAYVSAVDRAVEPRFPEPRKPPTNSKPRVAQWVVGRTVRIDPTLVQLARSGDREAQFRLKCRFIVRGHYRNQAHGPQRTLRTSKWISCFWKGPADGAELVHTYKIDDVERKLDE